MWPPQTFSRERQLRSDKQSSCMQMPESATHANSPAFSVDPVLERIQQSVSLANSHASAVHRNVIEEELGVYPLLIIVTLPLTSDHRVCRCQNQRPTLIAPLSQSSQFWNVFSRVSPLLIVTFSLISDHSKPLTAL